MGNCLKKELKSIVNNDNLLKIGELIISVETTAVNELGGRIWVKPGNTVTLEVDKNITIEGVTDTAFNLTGTSGYYSINFPTVGTYTLKFGNKYAIVGINFTSAVLDFRTSGYLENLESLYLLYNGEVSIDMGKSLCNTPFGGVVTLSGSTPNKRNLLCGAVPKEIFSNHQTGDIFLNNNKFNTDLTNVSIPSTAVADWVQLINSDIKVPDVGTLINGAHIERLSFGGSQYISGDLSSLGLANVKEIRGLSNDALIQPIFTWKGERTGKFIYLSNVQMKTSSDVDNMLINLSTLTDFTGVTKAIRYLNSPVHTSAADSAIATLKANGVEVWENGVQL